MPTHDDDRARIAIVDVWLPAADGVELCRTWRRSGLRIPVLMLTARTDVASRRRRSAVEQEPNPSGGRRRHRASACIL
jgi:DNA-binding response OmpR family regulator